ncbi:hypothetical protein EHP00_879 [Ecytonucleospora hepatopenaei]|uniref:Uncharacterized protein n=1 Tax=Ecytonucleospora hepatopenaei TaxID=646526 RepID=A0A1W0E3Y4_9MICR|nr:hypothetical protein EHP00_879 [Ecytonucleospora hepatopenaei]
MLLYFLQTIFLSSFTYEVHPSNVPCTLQFINSSEKVFSKLNERLKIHSKLLNEEILYKTLYNLDASYEEEKLTLKYIINEVDTNIKNKFINLFKPEVKIHLFEVRNKAEVLLNSIFLLEKSKINDINE